MEKQWTTISHHSADTRHPVWNGVERRHEQDRRQYSLRSLYYCLTQPRRTRGRRKNDRRDRTLDVFDGSAMALVVLLMAFSIMDAVFTLTLLQHGGSELNPVMNHFLQMGTGSFMISKLALTAIPAIILVALGDFALFNRFRARSTLSALVGLYAGLLVYEIGLISLL